MPQIAGSEVSFAFASAHRCLAELKRNGNSSFFNMRSALPLLQSVATKRIIINDPRIFHEFYFFVFVCIHVYSCFSFQRE